ncbi:BTAD domain-containing putative transcriptional regulator [Streptomyces sp. NPDC020996]|uniref:BTAD domain-containing putative transcriptional regulator n=1 Tax=Streptomyces sp. NPDC020996 TaxID=3154791 RepID=UPI0033DDE7BB
MTDIRLGVLGRISADVAGEPAALGGRVPRSLLALLVSERGRMVSADRIVDELWEGAPPASAVTTLHGYVASLRRALEPDRAARAPSALLVRQGPGYVLRVPPEAVDAERFTQHAQLGSRALAAGDPARAAEELDAAERLWRGPAYADCRDAAFARPEVVRLEALRLAAREDRFACALRQGEHVTAVAALQAHADEHPLRERTWSLLALALYRCGRQGDALAALRTVRERLVDELGADPGPELRKLEADILAQSPSLDLPRPVAAAFAPAARTGSGPEPVRTASASDRTRNLPRHVSSFVGRQEQLAGLRALLDEHRLVSVVGPGGMGKTRLANEAAAARDDLDGPWLVELTTVTDPADLPHAIGSVLGLAGADSARSLAPALAGRSALLVLDNCEHVIDAAAVLVESLLEQCPELRVLATSREPLRIAGEAVLDLPPLNADGPDSEAVRLFRDRARTLVPTWQPSDEELLTLAEVCRALDGMPLAIELAAAHSRTLSVRQIADHLDDRFALLSGGTRTAPQRHRSLEAAVAWSHESLDVAERRFFDRLSVFAGSFDLDAARRVTGDSAALSRITGLVAKSLVTVEPGTEPRRYRMLETLRHYGDRQLTDGERREVAARHRAWAEQFAEEAGRRARSADTSRWLGRLEAELPNFRTAITSAFAAGEPAVALRIATELYWFFYRRGHVGEGLDWLTRGLAEAPPADPALYARGYIGKAVLHYLSGDLPSAGAALDAAQPFALEAEDPEHRALVLCYRAYFLAATGDVAGAAELGERALALAREAAQPWVEAEALMVLGQVARASGDLAAADALIVRAVSAAHASGHEWAALSSTWIGLKIAMDMGDRDHLVCRARELVQELYEEWDVTSWLVGLHSLAGCLTMLGRPGDGAVLLGTVAAIGGRIGFFPERMDPLDGPRNAEAVRAALSAEEFDARFAEGRGLARAEATAYIRDLLG